MIKKFAFYLPQYHEIDENNEWWGRGFTEWNNVNAAKPLFSGHYQPQIPLNNNYYNLLNKETVKWQTDLMKTYHVDGLIYYHYYFEGKMLLEKPAENLLEWKEIIQPFFFCWANHTWYRSWRGSKEVLIEQTYGKEECWEHHFNYLLPYFLDKRYEKKDNKPVFMIFRADFEEKNRMFEYFEEKCKENGFDGIYLIETVTDLPNRSELNRNDSAKQQRTIFYREPNTSNIIFNKEGRFTLIRIWNKFIRDIIKIDKYIKVRKYDGNLLYNIMLKSIPRGANILHGVFFEWDNTPRHSSRGYIISPPSKDKFFEFMNSIKNEEYVFINAWNEWAEGMMLEPTERNGYKYLEWIKEWDETNNAARL
jgi:hypothetical protein